MNNRRIGAIVLLACLLLVCLGGCGSARRTLRIGTGGEGGVYYAYGNALAPLLEDTAGLAAEVRSTTGSQANLRLLQSGMIDLAIVQSDTLRDAAEGTGSFSDGALDGYSAVAGLYTEACQIIVTESSGIRTVADLAGKRVSIGEEDSGVTRNAEQLLTANGLTPDRILLSRLSFADAAAAMARGELDAFFCTAGAPTGAVAALAETTDIRLLSIDRRAIDQLTGLYDCYTAYTIPAGTYPGQTEAVTTLGVRAVLVASDTLDAETVQAVTALLFEHNADILAAAGIDAPLTQAEAVAAVPVGFHPGAAAYYAQQGISVTVSEPAPGSRSFRLSIDMYQTLALAVAVLYLGHFLRRRIKLLETFCIPAPVIGGLLFAIVSCVLYSLGIVELTFDETLRNVCMVIFFTSVGFQANLKVLRSGGVSLLIFLVCVTLLIAAQNGLAIGAAGLLSVDPMVGMCTGSIPMVGGHGTAGAFGTVLEDLGLEGATTLCTAAATFGLIGGSLMGGPLGRRLILRHDLLKTAVPADEEPLVSEEKKHRRSARGYAPAAYLIAVAMGIGTLVSWLLSKTGMSFPVYIGAMIVAAVLRNAGEFSGRFEVPMGEINDIGGICLSLFLGIAMITLKLWQLADLALPLLLLLAAQTLLMYLFARFVVFNVMGRDYDAAVLAAGTCGFGMGATPNAMANMQALTDRYAPSVKAYILVPVVGSMFADFINSLAITFFINLL